MDVSATFRVLRLCRLMNTPGNHPGNQVGTCRTEEASYMLTHDIHLDLKRVEHAHISGRNQ